MPARPGSGLTRLSVAGIRLTARGWGFLVAGLVLLVVAYGARRSELLPVASLLLALPATAVVLVAVRRPRFEVSRGFAPDVVAVGAPVSARVHLRNRRGASSPRVAWWELLPWAPWATDEGELPPVRSRAHGTVGYDLRPPRRGVFAVGPIAVQLTDPFQLAVGLSAQGAEQQLIVTPEAVPLPESGLTVPAGDGQARLVQRRAAGDEDDTMTREYRPGDAMRRVHWRASARHDELMVRQEEQRSLPRARILVDTLRDGYPDADGDGDDEVETFEWVVRMLASVAVHLRRSGFAIDIHETGPQQLHVQARRTWGDEEFLAGLAAFRLHDDRGGEPVDSRDEGPLIALVGRPDDETVDWMLRHRRPGTLAVAYLVQPLSAVDRLQRSFDGQTAVPHIGERLADAGWLVVPVGADEDHTTAWSAVVAETGRARGA